MTLLVSGQRRAVHHGHILPSMVRFLILFGAAYVANIVAVLMMIRLGFNDYLAHVVGMPLYTVAFYIGCRTWVFPRKGTN